MAETKNTQKDKLFKDFEKALKDWSAAAKKGDTEVSDIMQQRAIESYNAYKQEADFVDKSIGVTVAEFGDMFESALPTLIKTNKKAVGEVLRLIKEDENIKSQLKFFESMKRYDGSTNATDYINDSIELASKNLNFKTLKESKNKLRNLIVKHNIRESINPNKSDLFASGTYLLTHTKKLSNLNEINAHKAKVEAYISSHKSNANDVNKIDIAKMTESYKNTLNLLSEDDRELVDIITNSKTTVAEEKQKKFFDNIKNECLKKINKMIDESSEDEKNELYSIKEDIQSMVFCKESVVKDTAKLLEVGAILSDK